MVIDIASFLLIDFGKSLYGRHISMRQRSWGESGAASLLHLETRYSRMLEGYERRFDTTKDGTLSSDEALSRS